MKNLGNIFFCGDLHGEFSHLLAAVKQHQPDAVVLLGDIMGDTAPRRLEQELVAILDKTQIWWIHGNHDTDQAESCAMLFNSALAERNLHGRVVEVAGVRIAGLGGVFRGRIWSPPAPASFQSYGDYLAHTEQKRPRRLRSQSKIKRHEIQESAGGMLEARPEEDDWHYHEDRKHRSSIFPEEYERLICERADVLVTHEAPDCHPHGHEAISELAQLLGVKASFHGHQHDNLDYSQHTGRLGFAAHGVGLRGISDLHGKVIVAGELDYLRQHRQSK